MHYQQIEGALVGELERLLPGLGVANRDIREHGDLVRHPLLEVFQTARIGDTPPKHPRLRGCEVAAADDAER